MTTKDTPYMIERIVAAASYLTMGMAGFIWLIIALFTKARIKTFSYVSYRPINYDISYLCYSFNVFRLGIKYLKLYTAYK